MPGKFLHGMHLAEKLRVAMGIDRPIRSITVVADCTKAASVTVEFVPTVEEGRKIIEIMESCLVVNEA